MLKSIGFTLVTGSIFILKGFCHVLFGGIQPQFLENICSKDDLRFRIFGTLAVKFLACLPLLGFSNIENGIVAQF